MSFPTAPLGGTWQPVVAARFIEPLIQTARELILRDQAAALAYVSQLDPVVTLPDFQHVMTARRAAKWYENRVRAFPLVVLAPSDSKVARKDTYVDGKHRIAAEVVVFGSDPEVLTTQLLRYVAAVDLIWRSAKSPDLMWNLDPDVASVPEVDVEEHAYSVISDDGPNAYIHTALMTLTGDFEEE
jgi:hypothetical protein